MTREEIINKILKIKALAEGGESGERSVAENMLKKLMDQYNISEDDLGIEKEEVFYFKIHGDRCLELFKQIAVIYCDVCKMVYIGNDAHNRAAINVRNATPNRPRGTNMTVLCTPAKFLELQYAYEIFQKSFNKHVDGLIYAFLETNNLLAPPDPNNPKSGMDDEGINMAYKMGMVVEKTDIHKALPQNKLQ